MPLRSNFMHFCIIFVKVLNRYKLVFNWLYKRNEKNLSSMKIKRNNVTEKVFADHLLKKCRMVKIVSIIVVMTMLLSVVPIMPAQAASAGTATLRIISTTDLHGQIGQTNYDKASEHYKGSLAQVYSLIQDARASLKYGNTLTVDVGDTVYGYGSDQIYNGTLDCAEYMYEAMASMGYDAMTLGNHEFDYGYTYIKDALEEAGLDDKMIVSNVFDAKTRKTVWAENKIITKTLNTTKGQKMTVRIGMIGVTIPVLSAQHNFTGELETSGMVGCVEEQVKKLKAQNADLIVVLAHSGIGGERDEELSKNVGYVLSKVDGIDAIIGGHSHVNFPSSDKDAQKYYDYEGVTEDGLINGKIYVSVADHAAGIGIADLKLQVANGKVCVVKKSAKVKKVTASTPADESILSIADDFEEYLDGLYEKELGNVDGSIDNYFGTLEDNAAIQAINEAKIQYGLEFVKKEMPEYASCPVIAATGYQLVGKESADDYIYITDGMTVADSLRIQNWDRLYSFVYYITGKQLREWMEYRAASAYRQPDDDGSWKDKVMASYVYGMDMNPVLANEWLDEWDQFMVFDGVEYEVDPTISPRYDVDGNVIHRNSYRITKLTCNGVNVTDDMKFILVSPPIQSQYAVVGSTVYYQKLNNERIYLNTLLQRYVKEQSTNGSLVVKGDQNWKVKFPDGANYVVKSSAKSEEAAAGKPWYVKTLGTTQKDAYFQAAFGKAQPDTGGPTLVVGAVDRQKTGHPVRIAVQANDISGVSSVQYYKGVLPADSASWSAASNVQNGEFKVSANGVYSVRARDRFGNSSVRYITVNNYDANALETPVVTKYSNRNKQISGTAEPDTQLYIRTPDGTYNTAVSADGKFSLGLPLQKAGKKIRLWVQNSRGQKSDELVVEVERTGPNYPDVDQITNKKTAITGFVNDSDKYCKIVAIVDKTIYVPENGGEEAYSQSELYDEAYQVVPVKYEVSDGYFELSTPVFYPGTEVKVYSLDWISRQSVVTKYTTEDVAPNLPIPYEVYAMDDYIYGKIPQTSKDSYGVAVDDGTDVYTGTAGADGFFAVKVGKLKEGQQLSVTATDVEGTKTRTSAAATVTVCDYKQLLSSSTDITFEPVTNKDTQIKGNVDGYEGKVNLLVGTTPVSVQTDENGDFVYTLKNARKVGTVIAAMIRNADGEVEDVCETTVKLAIPDAPVVLDEVVYDTASDVKVFAVDQAVAVVKAGAKYYKCTEAVYDRALNGYVYTVKFKKPPVAGSKIQVFMMNDAGKSAKVRVGVEAAPEPEPQEPGSENDKGTEAGSKVETKNGKDAEVNADPAIGG